MNKKMNLQLFDGTANMAATTDTGLSAEIKEYYIKELLENAKPKLVHGQFGQKKPIPRGSGKVAEWRKFSSLPPALTPLVEGVTPNGTKRTAIKATVSQYGDYIKHTDMLQTAAFDNVIVEDCKEQGNQAGNTIDLVTRNAMQATTSVAYAGGKTSRDTLTAADKLTVADVKKMVKGVMIESYIEEGNQKICDHMTYGKSITDPCLGWEDTEKLIYKIAEEC